MKAVILAGGKGTRLAPYTTVFPKPLVPLGEKPILEIIIRQLAGHGLTDITLSVGYLAELIQAYFATAKEKLSDVSLNYVREVEPTGTAGSLISIPGLIETFLVMNGDVLTTLNYSDLIRYHHEKGGILTIAMHKRTVKVDFGIIEIDTDANITGYQEKPEQHHLVSMGVYVYEPRVLDYMRPNKYLDFPTLVQQLIDSGEHVVGYSSDDVWLDIGRHEDYALAQEEFSKAENAFLQRCDK